MGENFWESTCLVKNYKNLNVFAYFFGKRIFFLTGCVEAVSEYLIDHVTIIAYAGIAFIAAQMLAIFLAFKFRHLATQVGLNSDI